MTPHPVEAENTAIRGCDDHGPLVDWLVGEDLTTGQARVIIRFTVGTRGDVGPLARWAHFFDSSTLSHDESRLDAVQRLESTWQLRNLAACSCDTDSCQPAP